MGISQDEVFSDLKRYIPKIWECYSDGFQHYRQNSPDQEIHRKSTRASNVNDIVFARIVSAFDEVPGAQILTNPNQPRFLSLSDRVTLWFKKMDDFRHTSNYPTDEAIKRDGGQSDLFNKAEIVVAGYILNDDETAIKRISFTPPKYVKPFWFVDVEAASEPIRMNAPQPIRAPKIRLRITVGPKQFMLG